MSQWRRKPAAGAVALVALLAGACVRPDDATVSVKTLNADVVFGVEDLTKDAATPANAVPVDPEAVAAVESGTTSLPPLDDGLPSQTFTTAPRRVAPRTAVENPASDPNTCRVAGVNDFPAETAPLNIPDDSRIPKEGVYRWKRAGTVRYEAGSNVVEQKVDGFEQRTIQKVVKEPQSTATRIRYTYEVVQPYLGNDGILVTTRYRVDSAAPSAEVQNTLGPERASGGDPERGLSIKGVQYRDRQGNRAGGDFSPTTGLLIAPLPVRTGELFSSVAVEPATQQTYRYDGQQVKRDRVDACGTVLEGWRVNGTLSISGSFAQQVKYSFVVAPHLGELIIGENVEGTFQTREGVKVSWNLTYTLGQTEPSPPAAA